MKRLHLAGISTLALALAACGGGSGGGVASAPPPPPAITSMSAFTQAQVAPNQCSVLDSCVVTTAPLPSSPADKAATYDTIALKQTAAGEQYQFSFTAKSSDLQIKVNPANGTYTLTLDDGSAAKVERTYNAVNGFGNSYTVTGLTKPGYDDNGTLISPGGTRIFYSGEARTIPADSRNNGQFQYQWGLRHVSLGYWAAPAASGTTQNSSYFFVHGDKTPTADLPVSGTASYRVVYSEGTQLVGATTDLTVDFVASTLSFTSRRDPYFAEDWEGNYWMDGFDISSTAAINRANSVFAGPLSGTLIHFVDGNISSATVDLSLTGQLSGGFFGPQASELGGLWFAATPDGTLSLAGAFVGAKN